MMKQEQEKIEEVVIEEVVTESSEIDWKDKCLRLQAEFDNYRKRTNKEKISIFQMGSEAVVKAFLPVVDDLERAVTFMENTEDLNSAKEGITLISQKTGDILKQCGVSVIENLGLPLNTDLHDAIASFPGDPDMKGLIIDVQEKGYMMGDNVIRFSKVIVGE